MIFFVVLRKHGSRRFATVALIGQIILIIFSFILIGITGNYLSTGGYYNSSYSISLTNSSDAYATKYKIVQAELAFGVLMLCSGLVYIGIYIYVTIAALWIPHHTIAAGHAFK